MRQLLLFASALVMVAESSTPLYAQPAVGPSLTKEAPFLAENDAAMTRMMNDMAPHPTGDIDADFTAMMIPHHQGAIDMAITELRYGRNEQLRRIAQEIIVDQQQEIAAMKLAMGSPLPLSAAAPTQQVRPSARAAPPRTMSSMDMPDMNTH